MYNTLNKRGFTLIELLAVIVILSVLLLVAMPNVLGLMDDARRNAFVTEAQEYVNAAQTAYISDQITNSSNVNAYSTGNYYYYCITIQSLNEKYITKNNSAGYSGTIEVLVPKINVTPKETLFNINFTNGSYAIKDQSLKSIATGKIDVKPGSTLTQTSCPGASSATSRAAIALSNASK